MSRTRYQQVLLETTGGLFAVSVTGDMGLDERGRIVNPQEVFEEGSTVIAVEQGVLPIGEYEEHPNPFEIEEAEAEAGGNGKKLQSRTFQSEGPRHGAFIVKYAEGTSVELREVPTLGDIL